MIREIRYPYMTRRNLFKAESWIALTIVGFYLPRYLEVRVKKGNRITILRTTIYQETGMPY
jgi:hypothetical protein